MEILKVLLYAVLFLSASWILCAMVTLVIKISIREYFRQKRASLKLLIDEEEIQRKGD